MTRLITALCFGLAIGELWAEPLHLSTPMTHGSIWSCECVGHSQLGADRAHIEQILEQLPGNQLVFVRYSASHDPGNEWVYNSAEIENSKVIWAREMSGNEDLDLIRYYKGRQVWLVEPDAKPPSLRPYFTNTDSTRPSH
jgi:hypothetical protein